MELADLKDTFHWLRSKRWLTLTLLAALLCALPIALGTLAFVLEYRTQFITTRLGQYLLAHNAQRPRKGSIWQAIEWYAARRWLGSTPPMPATLRPPGVRHCQPLGR